MDRKRPDWGGRQSRKQQTAEPASGEDRLEVEPAPQKQASPTASMRRHPRWVLIPVAGLLALALCAGLARTPTYKASARLAVGGLSATNPAELTGFADAAQQLAQTYSRSVAGDGVVDAVARRSGSSPEEVRSRLSASPIPETPVFQLEATSDSPGGAIELTNLASAALAAEVDRSGRSDSARLLEDYRAAELERERADKRVAELSATPGPTLVAAESELLVAEARAESLREAYGVSLQSESVPLQVIQEADSASSDRGSVMQLLAFIALVAGLVVGIALAVFRDTPAYVKLVEAAQQRRARAKANRARSSAGAPESSNGSWRTAVRRRASRWTDP